MTRVKICGLTNAEDAHAAAEAGADALGFIFYPKSKRYVTPAQVKPIVSDLPPFVTTVGVFVNEPRDRIRQISDDIGLRALQLHGDEKPEDCLGYNQPVIRALRVGANFSEDDIEPYVSAGGDSFLLDKNKEGFYGGTGETFDWAAAGMARSYGRIILSGGLTPFNVEESIQVVQPYAVDTGSGVEKEPGKKDHDKVRAFIQRAMSVGMEN
ncbi:TPA: phosphoribosylanthranilate isomerase [Candidatus Latescibacteria bacterium]|nr:phosphoribosylanthranilate isomerase [Candidatus Latescibacterota bacterium]